MLPISIMVLTLGFHGLVPGPFRRQSDGGIRVLIRAYVRVRAPQPMSGRGTPDGVSH